MSKEITKEKLSKYKMISEKALKIASASINKDRREEAEIILDMAKRYILDSAYFEKKSDFINAFAALNYAHGWLDTGSKLGIFDVKDNKLFVIK